MVNYSDFPLIKEQSRDFCHYMNTLSPESPTVVSRETGNVKLFNRHTLTDTHTLRDTHKPQPKERGLPKIDSSRDKPVASAIRINQTAEQHGQMSPSISTEICDV